MSTTTQHYQLVGWACILALFVLVRHANCESPTPLANPHNSDSHDEPVSHNTSSCCAQSSSDRQASLLTSSLPLPRTTAAASQRHLTQQQTPAPAPAPAAPDHKPLFPVNSLDIAVLVIAGVVLFIAAGAGMGGGPVLVPLYLVAGLNSTAAVALSNSTILAGSVGNTLCNVFKRHPYKNKPLIDWDLVLLMEPPTLIGAIAGSYINKLLPAWITGALLVLLLALMTVRVAQRATRIYQRESAARREEAEAAATAAAAALTAPAAALPAAAAPAANSAQVAQQPKARGLHTAAAAGTTNNDGDSSDAAAAVQQARGGAGSSGQRMHAPHSSSNVDGVLSTIRSKGGALEEQLLAEERAAHVGPSDQPPPQQQPAVALPHFQHTTATGVRPAAASMHTPFTSAGAQQSAQATTTTAVAAGQGGQGGRMARACSAPAPPSTHHTSTQPPPADAHQRSPFRGTLSTVPSSVLLNVELEGNISEAALQRLAMIDNTAAAASAAAAADPVEASLSSMFGVATVPTTLRWHQQQQQQGGASVGRRGDLQQQQQQSLQRRSQDEPPSEAECRLAYAPPAHTRKDSWELAWEEERQDEQQQQQELSLSSLSAQRGQQSSAQHSRAPTPPKHSTTPSPPPGAAGVELVPHHQPPASAAAAATGAAGRGQVEGGRWKPWQTIGTNNISNTSRGALLHHQPHTSGATAAAAAAAAGGGQGGGGSAAAGGGGGRSSSSRWPSSRQQAPPEVAAAAAAGRAEAIDSMLAAEAAQVPLLPCLLLLVMLGAVLLTSLFSKMLPCGGAAYWLVQCSVAPALLVVWGYSRRRVLAKVALKKAAQLDFHGEVRWTPRKSLVFPAICSLAGLIAGLFGLGGAVVKTPLMLELGVHPLVTAATTQTMLLLTSSASSVVYAALGDTPWDWAAVMMPVAFVATLAGQAAIDWLVKKVGRSSMVVLVLAAFFIVATCLSVYTMAGAARTVAANPGELLWKLGKICR